MAYISFVSPSWSLENKPIRSEIVPVEGAGPARLKVEGTDKALSCSIKESRKGESNGLALTNAKKEIRKSL